MSGQPKLYGISLRQVNGIAVAWRVSIRRRGRNVGRLFSVKAFGSLKKALKAAIAFRDEVNEIFPPLTKQEAHAIRRSTNTSGVPGVFRTKTGEWKASIQFEDGTCKTRQFAVHVYGEDRAKQLAVEARVELLKQIRGHLIYHDEKSKSDLQAAMMSLLFASPHIRRSLRPVPIACGPIELRG
ncbi:hypothetical protein GO497_03990 [Acidovorax citrulli]|nr:hypothetical protein [Paracidovorax citrulli]